MSRKCMFSVLLCALLVVALMMLPVAAQDAELITKVQSALKDKGLDPGPIDGLMGPRTSSALRDFQIQNDIQVSGKIDKETLRRLGIKGSFMGRIGSGFRSAGGAVAGAATTAGRATARGARAAADASVTAAEATASGATTAARASATGAQATAKGATTGAKAMASVAQTGASAAAKGVKVTAAGATTGAKATARGATASGKAIASGARAATSWLLGKKGGDLADRVEARLKKDLNLTSEDVWVRTEDKNVYLIVSGGSQAEWNRAVVVARKVDGVDNVFIRLPK